MKIAYLVNSYPQASHSFIRREIVALEEAGVEIVRISIREPKTVVDPADQEELGKTFIIFQHLLQATCRASLWKIMHPIKTFRAYMIALRMARHGGGWIKQIQYFTEGMALASWARKWGITHIHAHFGTNSAAVAMYCRLCGGPAYSMTVHGPEEFDAPQKLGLGEKIHHAAFVVAISEFGRSQLFRWCRLQDWGKIHVVHCGVDETFLNAGATSVPEVARLVCVGRLCEQKGQLVLVKAVAKVIKEGVPVELVLVGDGPMRSEIESLIGELGISNHVRITGWQSNEQVREHILSGRAMVLPSFAEGLPVVIMEALALGRPVISTYVAGIPELVEQGVNGWLVPAGSVNKLKDCMREVLGISVQKLTEMGQRGAQRVIESHNAKLEGQKMATLFARYAAMQHESLPAAKNVEAI